MIEDHLSHEPSRAQTSYRDLSKFLLFILLHLLPHKVIMLGKVPRSEVEHTAGTFELFVGHGVYVSLLLWIDDLLSPDTRVRISDVSSQFRCSYCVTQICVECFNFEQFLFLLLILIVLYNFVTSVCNCSLCSGSSIRYRALMLVYESRNEIAAVAYIFLICLPELILNILLVLL